jgi:hypothetical protein
MRHALAILAAAVGLSFPVLALAPQGAAAAPSTTKVTYALPAVTAAPNAPCDFPPCQVFTYTFTGAGTAFPPAPVDAPTSGAFSWSFAPTKYKPGSVCAFAAGTGTVSIIWQDNSITDATFAFKSRDSHTWSLTGHVTGGTNTFYPPAPVIPVSGVVGFPPNPCDGGAVSATISFFPPAPF